MSQKKLTRSNGPARGKDSPWRLTSAQRAARWPDLADIDAAEAAAWGYSLLSPAELAAPVPDVNWLIRGLWPEASYGPWGGDKKTLKTYCAMIAAVGLAAGRPAFNNPVWSVPRRRSVLYYGGEGGQAMYRRRLQRIAAEVYGVRLDEIPLHLVVDGGSMTTPDFQSALIRNCDAVERAHPVLGGLGLVVLDSVYNYHPADVDVSNLYARGPMLSGLSKPLVQRDIALWTVDHFNKHGSGIDLDRLAQSGMSAWSDSWVLVEHAKPADLDGGQFWLRTGIGTRQGGAGSEWEIDITLGPFDEQAGVYLEPMRIETRRHGAAAPKSTEAPAIFDAFVEVVRDHEDGISASEAEKALQADGSITAGSRLLRDVWQQVIDDADEDSPVEQRDVRVKTKDGKSRKVQRWFVRGPRAAL